MYWVRRNVAPNIAKNVIVMPVLAALNRGFLKKRMSSIGWSVVRSHQMNAPSSTIASAERDQDQSGRSSRSTAPR